MSCKIPSPSVTPQALLNAILCLIRKLVTTSGGTSSINVDFAGGEQAFSIITVSTSGSVAAGAKTVEFHPSVDFTGTIDGATYAGATWQVLGPFTSDIGGTLDAIPYTVTAGTLNILKTV